MLYENVGLIFGSFLVRFWFVFDAGLASKTKPKYTNLWYDFGFGLVLVWFLFGLGFGMVLVWYGMVYTRTKTIPKLNGYM